MTSIEKRFASRERDGSPNKVACNVAAAGLHDREDAHNSDSHDPEELGVPIRLAYHDRGVP